MLAQMPANGDSSEARTGFYTVAPTCEISTAFNKAIPMRRSKAGNNTNRMPYLHLLLHNGGNLHLALCRGLKYQLCRLPAATPIQPMQDLEPTDDAAGINAVPSESESSPDGPSDPKDAQRKPPISAFSLGRLHGKPKNQSWMKVNAKNRLLIIQL